MNAQQKLASFVPFLKVASAALILAGIVLVINPRWMAAVTPGHVLLGRWIGILIAAYGVSVALASIDPARHWPVFLAGFLAMPFLVLVTLPVVIGGHIASPWVAWAAILLSIIWAVPSGILLLRIAEAPAGGRAPVPVSKDLNLDLFRTQEGQSLAALSNETPVLLVLLRHLGCTFCRETLADIAAQRREIEATGARIVFVHMGEDEKTQYLFERYRISDIPRISDPDARLYQALGLERASILDIYGPGMWRYAVQSILLDGHGMGQIVGDRFQMPGVFVLHQGTVVSGFRHNRISDHPDYVGMLNCISQGDDISF